MSFSSRSFYTVCNHQKETDHSFFSTAEAEHPSRLFQASSFQDFLSHLSVTWSCLWSDSGQCVHVTGRLWVTAIATSLVILTQLLVITSSDGAVYLSMLAVLTIPLGTLFWTLWKDTLTGTLIWYPDITVPSVFALIGMAIIIPAMILYEYLGVKEQYKAIEFQELD